MEACQLYCMSFKDAKYFDWKGPEFENKNAQQACTCKSAVGKKKQETGVFSGEVHCLEDAATIGDAESKITTASESTSTSSSSKTGTSKTTTMKEAMTTSSGMKVI